MQIHAELCFVPNFRPPCGFHVFGHQGGVLLFPAMRGEVPGDAWWAEDGVHFSSVPIDGSAIGLVPEPVVGGLNDHHWATSVTADGRAFFRFEHRLVGVSIGPRVAFEPLAYRSPDEWKFHLTDLTVDQAGTWWASGHATRDSLIGQVFSSPDAVTWQPVPSKFEGSVLRLIEADGRMHALHYKHVSVVTPGGATKLFSMTDHLEHVLFTPSATVGLGNGRVGVLPAGKQRSTYGAPPSGTARFRMAAVEGGYVLGNAHGLWSSADAKAWEPVPSYTGGVTGLVPSRSRVIVLNERGEVHVLRG